MIFLLSAQGVAGVRAPADLDPFLPAFTVFDDEWKEFPYPPKNEKAPYLLLYFENASGLRGPRKEAMEVAQRACMMRASKLSVVALIGGGVTYSEIQEYRKRFPKCIRFYLAESSDVLLEWIKNQESRGTVVYPRTLLVTREGKRVFTSLSPVFTIAFLEEFADKPNAKEYANRFQALVNSIESNPPRWQPVLNSLRALDKVTAQTTLAALLAANAYRFKSGGVPDSYSTLLSAYPGVDYLLDYFLDLILTEHVELYFQNDGYDTLDQISAIFNQAVEEGKMSPLVSTAAAFLNLIAGRTEEAQEALRRFPRNQWGIEARLLWAIAEAYRGRMAQAIDIIYPLVSGSNKTQEVLRSMTYVLRIMMEDHRVRGKEVPTEILVLNIAISNAYGMAQRQIGQPSMLAICSKRKDRWGEFCRSHRNGPQITFSEVRRAAS
ncbi:MAG: hypothetical protein V2G50_06385 [bacterium JZ-2024 1]